MCRRIGQGGRDEVDRRRVGVIAKQEKGLEASRGQIGTKFLDEPGMFLAREQDIDSRLCFPRPSPLFGH